MVWLSCNLHNGQTKANEGVGKRHDGCHNGEPPQLVEVGDLRQHNLDAGINEHERGVRHVAVYILPVFVETIQSYDGPDNNKRTNKHTRLKLLMLLVFAQLHVTTA